MLLLDYTDFGGNGKGEKIEELRFGEQLPRGFLIDFSISVEMTAACDGRANRPAG